GTTFGTILGFDFDNSIVISAAVAIGYTVIGGLRSVAYTDALQILFIVIGLGVALPFALSCAGGLSAVLSSYTEQYGDSASFLPPASAWGGVSPWAFQWGDAALLLIFGGIPWQVYFQRVLASRDSRSAVQLSIAAGLGCFIMAVPAVMIGLVGATFDWSQLAGGGPANPALTLPYVLRYLTSPTVALLGLTAVAAAVMSSVDSSILSASTLFSWNVYRPLIQRGESDAETRHVAQITVVIIGCLATLLALSLKSVYTLWFLCADLVYVILFPQLLMALFCRRANQVGVVAGMGVGLFLRLGGGEPTLGLNSFINYPLQNHLHGTLFPFRTFAMLASLATIWFVSRVTEQWIQPRTIDPEFFGEPTSGEEV
ncbi:MAG: sodium:solute symporter family transporter, partial [bacterium]